MRRVGGAERMWMRFVLQERVGNAGWRVIKAPGLGMWRKSRPAVRAFCTASAWSSWHRAPPTAWSCTTAGTTRTGELIRRAKRRSAGCRQPGPLPNLRVRAS